MSQFQSGFDLTDSGLMNCVFLFVRSCLLILVQIYQDQYDTDQTSSCPVGLRELKVE